MNLVSHVLVSLATLAAPGASAAAAAAPPVDTGRVAVIAQGAVPLTGTAVQWAVASETVTAGADPAVATGGAPTFIVTVEGALVLVGGDRPVARLGAGEAGYVPPDSPLTMSAEAGDTSVVRITLSPTGGLGTAFTPAPGPRDVEIRRVVLAAGEATDVAAGDAPTLLIGVSGAVDVTTPAGIQVVDASATAVIDGPLTIATADQRGPVVLLIGIVGPPVTIGETAPTTTSPTSSPATPTSGGAAPGVTAPSSSTTLAASTTTLASTLDSDGDGLTDADELARGTNPSRPDSDDDGLSDGNEVNDYGTDPLALDTDVTASPTATRCRGPTAPSRRRTRTPTTTG